jgi:hypothetical protein
MKDLCSGPVFNKFLRRKTVDLSKKAWSHSTFAFPSSTFFAWNFEECPGAGHHGGRYRIHSIPATDPR